MRRRPAALAAFILASLAPTVSRADGLNVSPVRVVLAVNQRAASITITNTLDRSETLRVESFAWDQADGKDRLVPTDELLVVPPILRVAPNAVKIVRLGLRTASAAARERTYRIFLTEVPPSAGPGNAITISYRFSVPVFLPPTAHASPRPVWAAERLDANHVRLSVRNDGDAHLRISTITVYSDASRAKMIRQQSVAGYVLAGDDAAYTIDVKDLPLAATLLVSAASGEDVDDIAAVVPVVQRP